jgi:DNA-directed RNA polymerase subunit RPC12/RpoP
MIRFKCPRCEKKLQVDESKAGSAATCPECGQKFRIPGSPPESEALSRPTAAARSPTAKKTSPSSSKEVAQPPEKTAPRPEESWERPSSTPYAVQKEEGRHEDPLDKYRPKLRLDPNADFEESDFAFDREYSSKKKKKREKELARLATIQTVVVGVIAFLAGAGLVVLAYFQWITIARVGAGALAAIGYIVILKAAEKEGTSQVLLCMPPFGNIFFVLAHWKQTGRTLLKFLLLTYIGLLALGGVFLISWLTASPTGQ